MQRTVIEVEDHFVSYSGSGRVCERSPVANRVLSKVAQDEEAADQPLQMMDRHLMCR